MHRFGIPYSHVENINWHVSNTVVPKHEDEDEDKDALGKDALLNRIVCVMKKKHIAPPPT